MANTLADYSTYYWANDLRPGMTDNVILSNLPGKDPAPWQHLGFAALSLGTEGILNAKSTGATEGLISTGALVWPTPVPNATQPSTGGVDDLWHAAVNGRGRFINAKTSQELGRGILSILLDLSLPSGTDAGAAFGNPNLDPLNNFIYIASFDGSQGTVKKVELDPTTAAPKPIPAIWDAATELTTLVTPVAGFPDPWNTLRRIVTVNSAGVPVAFQSLTISAAQRATLGPDPVTRVNVVEYLRGNKALEGTQDGQLRARTSPLGDIVNSSPVAVGPPNWAYQDATDPGYSAFKTANAGRPTRVYVGANDGMLHAFDGADGKEAWAFIPRDLFRGAPNDKEGLVGLTYQVGGLPFYEHRYYVNATPRAVDVDFGGMNWRTLLVGGLGKGGKSIYALDVTDPASVVDEATAGSKVLWEFRNDDLGYTFGKPVIVKTRAFGWVVIVPSGYNNYDPVTGLGDGKAKIFVLRASTGALLKVMDTGFGAQASPAGLAHISGYVKDYRNQTVEQVYGGDLYGNVWRFDLSDPVDALWTTGLFATLKDPGGQPQPVTTPPQIEVDLANGVDRWVFVGTGRLLHENDLLSGQQQTMYALRDGSYDTPLKLLPVLGGVPPLTRADLDLVNNLTGLGAGVIAAKGWYDDLPVDSRMITAPVAAISAVGYVATGIATDPCQAGQPADVFVRAFGNGESILAVPPPVGSPPGTPDTIVESIYVAEGGAALNIVTLYDAACTGDCIPEFRIVVSTKKDSTVIPLKIVPPGFVAQHRLSFRFLNQ
jgi:type IV pilus assembly protein PilY1